MDEPLAPIMISLPHGQALREIDLMRKILRNTQWTLTLPNLKYEEELHRFNDSEEAVRRHYQERLRNISDTMHLRVTGISRGSVQLNLLFPDFLGAAYLWRKLALSNAQEFSGFSIRLTGSSSIMNQEALLASVTPQTPLLHGPEAVKPTSEGDLQSMLDFLCSKPTSQAGHLDRYAASQPFLEKYYFDFIANTEECRAHRGEIVTVSLFKNKEIKARYSTSIFMDYDETVFDELFAWAARVGNERETLALILQKGSCCSRCHSRRRYKQA